MTNTFSNVPEITERKTILKKLVIIDGLTRSGKTLIAAIVSSLDKVEQFRMHYITEFLPMFEDFGIMSHKAALALLVNEMDMFWYDSVVGRNLNFRPGDFTSIWRSQNPQKYFERLFSEERDSALERMTQSDNYPVMITHDMMAHPKIFFEAFPEIHVVYVRRHPLDHILDWYERGWGTRYHEDPLSFTIKVNGPTYGVPWYAYGWEEKYEKSCPMDRIIYMIDSIKKRCKNSFDRLSQENLKKTIIVSFEDMAYNPELEIDKICNFLGTTRSLHTSSVMKRENTPRPFAKDYREKATITIKELASDEAWVVVQEMIRDYESGISY